MTNTLRFPIHCLGVWQKPWSTRSISAAARRKSFERVTLKTANQI